MTILEKKSNKISNSLTFLSSSDNDLLSHIEKSIQEYKYEKQITQIPIRLFSGKLAALEVIVKYLKENGMNYAEIGRILNRNQKTIWITYSKAIKKQKEKFILKNDDLLIDIRIFSAKKSPLQTLIKHLLSKDFSIKQIAVMLNRSYKNIWMISHE